MNKVPPLPSRHRKCKNSSTTESVGSKLSSGASLSFSLLRQTRAQSTFVARNLMKSQGANCVMKGGNDSIVRKTSFCQVFSRHRKSAALCWGRVLAFPLTHLHRGVGIFPNVVVYRFSASPLERLFRVTRGAGVLLLLSSGVMTCLVFSTNCLKRGIFKYSHRFLCFCWRSPTSSGLWPEVGAGTMQAEVFLRGFAVHGEFRWWLFNFFSTAMLEIMTSCACHRVKTGF